MRRVESGRTTPPACAGPAGERVQRWVTSKAAASPVVPTTHPNISSTDSRSPATAVDVTVFPLDTMRSVP